MSNFLQDRVVVVTGAGRGFGELISEKAAGMGARVVCCDINADAVDRVADRINAQAGTALAITADVTDLQAMQSVVEKAVAAFGSVDILVNNAGVMPLAFFADHAKAYSAWTRCIDINVKGVLNGIVAAHDQMIQQGRGHIINLSSIYGSYPAGGAGVYGATKAAVIFLSEALRVESQGKIKVTTIRPTGVPATGLDEGILNPDAEKGILGPEADAYMEKFSQAEAGTLPADLIDINDIRYWALDPDSLAEQIIYAMNQPWGVSISDITVRASGDAYVI